MNWARTLTLVAAATTPVLASCAGNGSAASDAVEFCVYGRENQSLIVAPPLESQADFLAIIDFYDLMGQLAPADIAPQWLDITNAMKLASEIEPGDPDSEQLVAQTAYSIESSAYDVMVWFRDYCNVDLPITTIVPHGPLDPIIPRAATTPPPSAVDEQ